jgi:hypothetical protein
MKQRLLSVLLLLTFIAFANPVQAVFIGDSSGYLYTYDISSNSNTQIGYGGVGAWYDIASNPTDGELYGLAYNAGYEKLFSIDKLDGSTAAIGNALGNFINGLTFDSSGTLYASGSSFLYTIDLLSGNATSVGSTGFQSSGDLAFDSSGNLFMSATGGTNGSDRLISIDTTLSTGYLGSVVGNIGFDKVYGLNFTGSTLYGFTQDMETISIDTGTGAGALSANNSIAAWGADGAGGVNPVPEPATLILFGAGIIGLAGLRIRRKRR